MALVPARLQPANVATPAVVDIGLVVQPTVAPTWLTESVIELGAVTMLLTASSTVTWGWGASAAPLVAAPNAVLVNTRCVAVPNAARTTLELVPVTDVFVANSV